MTAAPRFKDGFYTVEDGLRLHFRDYSGDMARQPLMCLPALTRNARDFEALAERVAPRRRVVAVDFRGRGLSQSDPHPERYLPLTYTGDVIRLMDHLGFAEAIFVGTSLGGLVTMALCALEPDRIVASILNDVGPDLEQAGLERINTYVGKGERFASWDEVAAAVAANHRGLPADYTQTDWLRLAKRMAREENGTIRFDYDPAIAVPFRTTGPAPAIDLWPLFATLAEKPVLVIRGGESDLLSARTLAKMAEVSTNVKTVTVPGAGHAPTLDEPVAVAAIDAFLARLD